MAGKDDEACAVGAHPLVLGRSDLERLRTGWVAALADEHAHSSLAPVAAQFGDALVHFTKEDSAGLPFSSSFDLRRQDRPRGRLPRDRPPPRQRPELRRPTGTRGVFAHTFDDDSEQLQSTVDIVLKRFAEYHNLEGAFARRATIERAKGILMATHAIDEQQAFAMFRKHSQQSGQRLLDLAEAITQSHRLLAQPHDH